VISIEGKIHRKGAGMKGIVATLLAFLVVGGVRAGEGGVKVDPKFSAYASSGSLSGNLSSVGSDTLNNLMTFWAEKFNKFYPSVKIGIEGKGSGTAPTALIAGTSQLGPMSREMKATESDAFEKKFGYKPASVKVAVDALAVFVNKDNPIKGLTFDQVDAIFSKSRRRGGDEIHTWGQLGLEGEWADKPISIYGRNSASGTYGFFKEHVLKNGDYRDEVKEQPGSASVVQSVTVDRYGIGYSGIGYTTAGVRAVPLVEKAGGAFVEATAANAYAGKYPLARFLFVYLNRSPEKPVQPIVREFLKMVLSKDGQEVVVKDGFFPVPFAVAGSELKKLE
jgi:phosphate transport system substrate-binding protein